LGLDYRSYDIIVDYDETYVIISMFFEKSGLYILNVLQTAVHA